jgi:hypothetical protein
MYTVSGLNCSATPISIAWEVQGTSAAPANIDAQATSNGNILKTSNTSSTPVMIACYTSRLEIRPSNPYVYLSNQNTEYIIIFYLSIIK